jgi:hypothetical protein
VLSSPKFAPDAGAGARGLAGLGATAQAADGRCYGMTDHRGANVASTRSPVENAPVADLSPSQGVPSPPAVGLSAIAANPDGYGRCRRPPSSGWAQCRTSIDRRHSSGIISIEPPVGHRGDDDGHDLGGVRGAAISVAIAAATGAPRSPATASRMAFVRTVAAMRGAARKRSAARMRDAKDGMAEAACRGLRLGRSGAIVAVAEREWAPTNPRSDLQPATPCRRSDGNGIDAASQPLLTPRGICGASIFLT